MRTHAIRPPSGHDRSVYSCILLNCYAPILSTSWTHTHTWNTPYPIQYKHMQRKIISVFLLYGFDRS